MALISCPECNKQISDTATACIGCGAKVIKCKSQSSGLSTFFKVIIGVLVVLWVIGTLSNKDGTSTTASTNNYSGSLIPLDDSVDLDEKFTMNGYSNLILAVSSIQQKGNVCDSVTSARVSVYDGAWSLQCNNLRYEYEFKDVGGIIEIKVIR